MAWGIAALCLIPEWGLALYLGNLVSATIDTTLAMLLALGLAFIPYIRDPARRLIPSLLFCAALVVHASWLAWPVVRTFPSKAAEFTLELETNVCRKAFGCSPPADIKGLVDKCIQGQMEGATGLVELGRRFAVDQKAWEKCESLDCEAFSTCFNREVGLLVLAPDQERRLLRLVCEAIQDDRRRGQTAADTEPSSKWTRTEQALEELQNPQLAAALIEEGRQHCPLTDSTEPGTGDRMPK